MIRGRRTVIPGLSARITRGSITGLLGPSGCGKTTLMRCIVGTQLIAAGSVNVLGLPAGSPGLRHRVGYVAQSPTVYNDLKVMGQKVIQALGIGTGEHRHAHVGQIHHAQSSGHR